MKRLTLLVFALILLLCACADSGKQGATPDAPQSDQPQATEPATFATYEEDLALSDLTHDAVKRYRIAEGDYYAMCPMGDGVVLFSGKTETTLTYVTRDNLPVRATLPGIMITPDLPSVRVNDQGISYYAPDTHSLVFLNLQLRTASRIPLAEEIPGDFVLSEDWKLIYYFSGKALRCLDLRSGFSRLLKESPAQSYRVSRLLFGGAVVECSVSEGEQMKTLLISTENGKTLFSSDHPLMLSTNGDRFLVQWQEGAERLWLMGSRNDTPSRLLPLWEDSALLRLNGTKLTACRGSEQGIELVCYDLLENGSYATVQLDQVHLPVGLCQEDATGNQWILTREQETESFLLFSWNPAKSGDGEMRQTIAPYYTAQSPDIEGLERCETLVQPLREEYGLKICLWQDGIQVTPDGYQLTPEYSVETYEKYLPMLEKAIRSYPADIYKKLAKKSDNKKLTICLVREICGSNELGSPTREQGVYFIHKGSIYLALTVSEQIEASYYHELFHAMDSYIIVEAKTYDDWGLLNPDGFAYDNSYLTNETRDPGNYLEDETRAFIDRYSMSYPKEDRARVMEYAMQPGNDSYFTSQIMQKKLDTLCKGIRKGFKLKDEDIRFPWEQYLKS